MLFVERFLDNFFFLSEVPVWSLSCTGPDHLFLRYRQLCSFCLVVYEPDLIQYNVIIYSI